MDLALLNGKVFFQGALVEKNIGIENGMIKEIKSSEIKAEKRLDCKKKIILPGFIDPHVHMREPGLEHKEDWLSGSKAAAHGGVTTVLDMPNTKPPTITVELLDEKRELAKKSIVNYGFHFGSTADNLDEIKEAWNENIASVKVFMNVSTGKMLIEDEGILEKIFSNSRIVSTHSEGENVKTAVGLSRKCKNKLYLCHIRAKEELNYIKGSNAFVEVTPHHLFFTSKDVKDSFREMYPSIKSEEDQKALWNAIKSGMVSTIGSDHAPHTKEEKLSENPPRGVPGLETTVPALLNAVNGARIPLGKVVELCCENPAKIFGIKNKGRIEMGFDADLTVVDLGKEQVIEGKNLFTKCGWSPFEGMKLKGVVDKTIVNGKIVFNGADVFDEQKGKEVVIV